MERRRKIMNNRVLTCLSDKESAASLRNDYTELDAPKEERGG